MSLDGTGLSVPTSVMSTLPSAISPALSSDSPKKHLSVADIGAIAGIAGGSLLFITLCLLLSLRRHRQKGAARLKRGTSILRKELEYPDTSANPPPDPPTILPVPGNNIPHTEMVRHPQGSFVATSLPNPLYNFSRPASSTPLAKYTMTIDGYHTTAVREEARPTLQPGHTTPPSPRPASIKPPFKPLSHREQLRLNQPLNMVQY